MFSFYTKTNQRTAFNLSQVEDNGETMTISFEKPVGIEIQPGQCLSLYPFRHLPREAMKPLTLAIASGTHDKLIEVTFSKAAHTISAKKVLQSYKAGNKMLVDGPFGNTFSVNEPGIPLLVIAAGTGISLLRSVKHSAPANAALSVMYSAKTKQSIPYLSEVNEWAKDQNNYITLTQDHDIPENWHQGRINHHLQESNLSKETKILICGPDAFIKDTVSILQEKYHPLDNILVSANWIEPGNNNLIYSIMDKNALPLLENTMMQKKKM